MTIIYFYTTQVNSACLAHRLESLEHNDYFRTILLYFVELLFILKTFHALCVLTIQDMLKVSSRLVSQVNKAVDEEVRKKKSITKKVKKNL